MVSPQHTENAPAQRLLTAAGALFAQEGIRAVGVDRVLTKAGVARASLYHAFGSKDGLIAAYIDKQDESDRAKWEKKSAELDSAEDKILALFDLAHSAAVTRRFRGCLYLNAVTEFPDKNHPVAAAVARHRTWLRELLVDLAKQAGARDAERAAERIQLVYDGAVAGSKFSRDPDPIELGKDMARQVLAEHR